MYARTKSVNHNQRGGLQIKLESNENIANLIAITPTYSRYFYSDSTCSYSLSCIHFDFATRSSISRYKNHDYTSLPRNNVFQNFEI